MSEKAWTILLVFVCWAVLYYWLLVVTAPEDYEEDTSHAVQPVDDSDTW